MQSNQETELKDLNNWYYHWRWNQDIEGLTLWDFDKPFRIDSEYLQTIIEALFGIYLPLGTVCTVNNQVSEYWCTFPIFRKYCKEGYYIDPDWLLRYCAAIKSNRCEVPDRSYTRPLIDWKS